MLAHVAMYHQTHLCVASAGGGVVWIPNQDHPHVKEFNTACKDAMEPFLRDLRESFTALSRLDARSQGKYSLYLIFEHALSALKIHHTWFPLNLIAVGLEATMCLCKKSGQALSQLSMDEFIPVRLCQDEAGKVYMVDAQLPRRPCGYDTESPPSSPPPPLLKK